MKRHASYQCARNAFGNSSFPAYGSSLWNSLRADLRLKARFKRQLQTRLRLLMCVCIVLRLISILTYLRSDPIMCVCDATFSAYSTRKPDLVGRLMPCDRQTIPDAIGRPLRWRIYRITTSYHVTCPSTVQSSQNADSTAETLQLNQQHRKSSLSSSSEIFRYNLRL